MNRVSLRGFSRFWAAEIVLAFGWLALAGLYAALAVGILATLSELGLRGTDLTNARALVGTAITLALFAIGILCGSILLGVKFLLAINFAWPEPGRRWWQ